MQEEAVEAILALIKYPTGSVHQANPKGEVLDFSISRMSMFHGNNVTCCAKFLEIRSNFDFEDATLKIVCYIQGGGGS